MKTLARHSPCLDLVQMEGFFFPLFHMLQLLHFLAFHLHLVFKYNPYHDVITRFCDYSALDSVQDDRYI